MDSRKREGHIDNKDRHVDESKIEPKPALLFTGQYEPFTNFVLL